MCWYKISYQVKTVERISITTSRKATSSDAVKFAKQSRPDTKIFYQHYMYIKSLSNNSKTYNLPKYKIKREHL